jgi:hypothetical protein
MYTNGLLRGRLFFGPSKRSSSLRETERDIIEKTRFTEAEERKEARKKKRGRRRRRRNFYDFYDENAFLSVLFFFV